MILNPVIVWFMLGLILIVMEFFVPGIILVFFGAGRVDRLSDDTDRPDHLLDLPTSGFRHLVGVPDRSAQKMGPGEVQRLRYWHTKSRG